MRNVHMDDLEPIPAEAVAKGNPLQGAEKKIRAGIKDSYIIMARHDAGNGVLADDLIVFPLHREGEILLALQRVLKLTQSVGELRAQGAEST